MNEMFTLLQGLTSYKGNPQYGPEHGGDIKHSLADISKAKIPGHVNGCRPCALAVKFRMSSVSCAQSITRASKICLRIIAIPSARLLAVATSCPLCLMNVDVFATNQFGIEIENLRTNASSRVSSRIAFGLRAVGGACDACGLLARWVRARPTHIAIFTPCHRFRRAGTKLRLQQSLASYNLQS